MELPVVRKLVRAGRNIDLTWRYGFNIAPTLSYKLRPHTLAGEPQRVLADLNRDGVAMTSVGALLGENLCYHELTESVEKLETNLADRLSASRTEADDQNAVGRKTFLVELLGKRPVLDPNSIYARFALQKPFLQIANAYYGMYTRLRYYNVWHTLRTQSEARESQLWHYDREDHYILKVFVYLSDIDDGAGPFTYAPGSHRKGRIKTEPEYAIENGVRRTSDAQMAAVVPEERWIKCLGSKGTIIFADTRGYHKGGLARQSDRLMYLCMFTSRASQSVELFERPARMILPTNKEEAFALTT